MKQAPKQFPPVINKSQASYQSHVLDLLGELVKHQKENNRLLRKIAQEPQQSNVNMSERYSSFSMKTLDRPHKFPYLHFSQDLQSRAARLISNQKPNTQLLSKEQKQIKTSRGGALERIEKILLRLQDKVNGEYVQDDMQEMSLLKPPSVIQSENAAENNNSLFGLIGNTGNKLSQIPQEKSKKSLDLNPGKVSGPSPNLLSMPKSPEDNASNRKNIFLGKMLGGDQNSMGLIGQTLKTAMNQKKFNQKLYARISDIQPHADRRQTKVRINFLDLLHDGSDQTVKKIQFQQLISEWVGLVYRATASICWNMLQTQTLSFDETKVLFTENIIFNYLELMKDIRQSNQIQTLQIRRIQHTVTNIVNRESLAVLKFLCKQYPQTKIEAPNMALRDSIPMIDEKGRAEYDLVRKSGIKFKYKDAKDYAPEIMSFINYLIDVSDQQYDAFEKFIGKMFENLYVPLESRNEVEDQLLANRNVGEDTSSYREKVRKYTRFVIGRKIPKNTPKYTKEEIDNGIFFIKSPKIMRVIAKWVEELWHMINDPKKMIRDWFYPFKNHNGQEFHASYPLRNGIYTTLLQKRESMFSRLEQIQKDCHTIEGELTQQTHISAENLMHLSEEQINVGLFASNLKNGLSSYLFAQLNELIHFLLEIPLKVNEKLIGLEGYYFLKKAREDLDNINLVSFRIFDLLRCKCVSGQQEIIYMINHMRAKAEKSKELNRKTQFELVRVKDRLDEGSRDIMVNAQLYEGLVTQIQLSIASQVEERQDLLDKYNHFLYELRRSTKLGPLIENVSIWTSIQQRASYFESLCSRRFSQARIQPHIHRCSNPMIFKFDGPIVCISCKTFFHIPRTCLMNWQCISCQAMICGQCRYKGMEPSERKRQIFGNCMDAEFLRTLQEFQDFENIEKMPSICFFIKKNFLKIQISVIKNYEPTEHDPRELAQIVIRKDIRKIITRGFLGDDQSSDKTDIKNLIVYGIDPIMVSILTIPEIKKLLEDDPTAKIINLLIEPTYVGSVTEISNPIIKERTINDAQSIMAQKELDQITVVRMRHTNTIILAQIYIDNEEMRQKLTRRSNLQTLKRLARGNSSIICLEHKNMTNQMDIQWIETRIGQKLFNNLCRTVSKLYLNFGEMTNIQAMIYMSNVEILSISNNRIGSLKGVQGMHKLRSIQFDFNHISSMEQLSGLLQLEIIIGNDNKISSLQGVENLVKLQELSLFSNHIQSFGRYLNNLQSLEMLYLRKNNIIRYQEVKELPNLRNLSLSDNPLEMINPLTFAPNLKTVSFTGIELKEIPFKALEMLTLTELSLHQNKIVRISGLETQKNLKILGLNSNLLTRIEGLQMLKLEKLSLSNNQIKVIDGIIGIMNTLQELNIENNPIQNIGDLRKQEFSFQLFWTPESFTAEAKTQLDGLMGSVLIGSVAQNIIEGIMFM